MTPTMVTSDWSSTQSSCASSTIRPATESKLRPQTIALQSISQRVNERPTRRMTWVCRLVPKQFASFTRKRAKARSLQRSAIEMAPGLGPLFFRRVEGNRNVVDRPWIRCRKYWPIWFAPANLQVTHVRAPVQCKSRTMLAITQNFGTLPSKAFWSIVRQLPSGPIEFARPLRSPLLLIECTAVSSCVNPFHSRGIGMLPPSPFIDFFFAACAQYHDAHMLPRTSGP